MDPLIAFHDLQQGGRTRDLPYYRELATRAGSTLELGAGTGRVALELADVTELWANELDGRLLDELVLRAGARGLQVTPVPGDATELELGRRFDLILAPVGFAQVIGGPGTRRALLAVIARHLAESGLTVVALADVDEILRECATPAPEQRLRAGGETFTCTQLAAVETEDGARLTWESGAGPDVELTYHRLSTDELADEAREHGLRLHRVHHDAGDSATLGSAYCVLRP